MNQFREGQAVICIAGGMTEFKPGDVVECLHDHKKQFTRGALYVVAHTYITKYANFSVLTLDIEEDDSGSQENGWSAQYFRLADSTLAKIVLGGSNG